MPGIPLLEKSPVQFPDPKDAMEEPDGLLAAGGDLTPDWLITAYSFGIFPWFNDDSELIYWWSPTVRGVLMPGQMRVTRSFAKRLRNGAFTVRVDENFSAVVQACAQSPRSGQDGTWITPRMQEAYLELFRRGIAHCVEVWQDGALVGGLYGLVLGKIFFGESMFSRIPDASKVAFFNLQQQLASAEYDLIDCQMMNPHLATLGVQEMHRNDFLKLLENNRSRHPNSGGEPWASQFQTTQASFPNG